MVDDRKVTVGTESPRNCAIGYWSIVGVLMTVALFKMLSDTLDPDCFWHLRVAQQIQRDGVGPLVDHISFASIKQPWTPYSWLAELGMKRLWDAAGWQTAVLAAGLCASAFVLMVALSCLELAGPQRRFNSVLATALAACLSLPYLAFRPATFAILLLSVCAWLLLRDRRLGETSKAVWAIVPLTAVLVNVHLTAVMAPLAVASLMVGAILERLQSGQRVRRYALLLAATGGACLLTPMLPGVVRAAWEYQFQDVMVASGGIEEMRPIYSGARGAAITLVLIVLMSVALVNRQRVRAGEWIWLAASFVLLMRLGRFAPIFAMIFAPVLAATAPAAPDLVLTRRMLHYVAACLLALGLVASALVLPGRSTQLSAWLNRNGADAFGFPCQAADYVDQHIQPNTNRLFNEFTWGGYLAWRLGERYQVLVDGRTQLYTADFWRSTHLCDAATQERTLAQFDADAAVLSARDSLFRDSLVKLGWRSAYRDDFAEVLLPPRSEYANQ